MGETKKKQDLDWMIRLCEPTPSQHQKLLNCPFVRESETFNDPLLMSSLGPTQTQPDPNHILMLSLPDSTKPTNDDDDDAVFVTPPENQFRSSSELSDQRKKKRVRVSDDEEGESKKIRASQSDYAQVECTQPIVETQQIVEIDVVGVKKNVVVKTEVVVLDDSDSETDILGDDSVQITRHVVQCSRDTSFRRGLGIEKTDKRAESVVSLGDKAVGVQITSKYSQDRSSSRGLGSGKTDKRAESVVSLGDKAVGVQITSKYSQDRSSSRGVGSGKTDKRAESVVSLGDIAASIVGNETGAEDCVNGGLGKEKIIESNVNVVEKVVNVGNVNGDVGAGTSRNGFDETEKFAYNSKEKHGRRRLPESIQGDDEGNNNAVGKEKNIDFYDVLKMFASVEEDGVGEEVNFVETAKKRGIVFPRPRWWLPDW